MTTTWNPLDTGGWTLSNGDLTATSPDNNTMQNIFVCFANTAIPDDEKTYYEIKVSGAAVETAFSVGFGVPGFNPSLINIRDEGAIIPNATYVAFGYNLAIANSGDVIYDPQDNADYAATHPGAIAAPNRWPNGAIIGVLVDRIDNTVQFTLNGVAQGGPFDISGLGDKNVFPFADSWFKSGPVATINGGDSVAINGGTHGFAEPIPAGYTALDFASQGGDGDGDGDDTGATSNANRITVNEPSTLVAGQITITGSESDPSQPVSLDWRTSGIPALGASDWVKATVQSDGQFTATVDIDHPGTHSTMFYQSGTGQAVAAWSATPVAASTGSTGSTGNTGTTGTPSTVTIGSGPDTLALQVSEDAWEGNAQFTVSVDGKQIGGTQTATASHSAGQTQTFDVLGTFAAGSHTATVDFLNDAYGGSSATDRNLYVTGATIDKTVVSAATLSERIGGPQSFTFIVPATAASGSDTVTVNHPANLAAAVQTITGTETAPSQSVFLDWRTYGGPPVIGASDWVQATVQSNGQFSATVDVDHPGTLSTMYYHTGSGPVVAAWSATPT
jgi:hypothetical protein